ncbi:MAG: M20 family metallopeptidase [Candidatus Roizmanbacteria bacterium]
MRNEIALLSDLVEIKSYSGDEERLAVFITDWLKARSIDAFRQDGNVVAKIGGRDNSRAFILNSHMDTVVADAKWSRDPFKATVEGNLLYGLGSCDMKGGLTASLLLAEKFTGKVPPVDMWFTYVVREETDGKGSQDFAEWFSENAQGSYKDIAAIFTEPSKLTDIEHGHRGNIFVEAIGEGGSGHASRPSKLVSHSVRTMIAFSDDLQRAFEKWRSEFPSDIFEPPTVGEMTSISAGLEISTDLTSPKLYLDLQTNFLLSVLPHLMSGPSPDFMK